MDNNFNGNGYNNNGYGNQQTDNGYGNQQVNNGYGDQSMNNGYGVQQTNQTGLGSTMESQNGVFESGVNMNGQGNMYGNQQPQNMYGQGVYPQNQTTGTESSDSTLWLVLGIIQALGICCCNFLSFISGGVTIAFALMAKSQLGAGNIFGYNKNIKIAKIVNIIGWAVLIISFILNFAFGVYEFIFTSN